MFDKLSKMHRGQSTRGSDDQRAGKFRRAAWWTIAAGALTALGLAMAVGCADHTIYPSELPPLEPEPVDADSGDTDSGGSPTSSDAGSDGDA